MERSCAYCGGNRNSNPRCRCTYRFNRMGEFCMEMSNTSRQNTWGDVLRAIAENFSNMKPDTPVAFKLSVTRLDVKAIEKSDYKRAKENINV